MLEIKIKITCWYCGTEMDTKELVTKECIEHQAWCPRCHDLMEKANMLLEKASKFLDKENTDLSEFIENLINNGGKS